MNSRNEKVSCKGNECLKQTTDGNEYVCPSKEKCHNYCTDFSHHAWGEHSTHKCPYGRENECYPFISELGGSRFHTIDEYHDWAKNESEDRPLCQEHKHETYKPETHLFTCQKNINKLRTKCQSKINERQSNKEDMGTLSEAICQPMAENSYPDILPRGAALKTWPTLKFIYDGRDEKFYTSAEMPNYDSDNTVFAYCQTTKSFDRRLPVSREEVQSLLDNSGACYYSSESCLEDNHKLTPSYFEIETSSDFKKDDYLEATRCRDVCNNFYSTDGCIKSCQKYLKVKPIQFEKERDNLRKKLTVKDECAYYQPNPYAVSEGDRETEFPKRDNWCQQNCSRKDKYQIGPICKGGFDRIMGQCYCESQDWEDKQGFGVISDEVYLDIKKKRKTCQDELLDPRNCFYDRHNVDITDVEIGDNNGMASKNEFLQKKCPNMINAEGVCVACLSQKKQKEVFDVFCETR